MSQPRLTEADIRQLASRQSYDRGYRYYRDDAVADPILRGQLLSARVEGSDYEPYRVQVTFDEQGVSGMSCSCPYDWGGICKHVVAVLLVWVHEGDEIEARPALETRLASLTAVQLRQILVGIAAADPDLAELIEQEVTWLQEQPTAPTQPGGGASPVDINAVRREINKDFRLAGKRDRFDHGYYDEYDGLEMDPYSMVAPHLDKVSALLDAGDVPTAGTLIAAIFDAFVDGLTRLDDYVYEYNEDAFDEAILMLGATLAEVLLSQELAPAQQAEWLARIADWASGLGDLDVAQAAVEQGWSYPPLVAAMEGHITEQGAWEGGAPDYADELALARLRILARQGRQQAYINLAAAEGQHQLSIIMLAKTGDVEQAVAAARQDLFYPGEILGVTTTLAAAGALAAALEVAEHGLTLEQNEGLSELAQWTREQAGAAGNQPLALKAAQVAFQQLMTLANYTAVQQLAGDQWPAIRPALLQQLPNGWRLSDQIDIYLHEKMLAEAMAAVDKHLFHMPEADLGRVVAATRGATPEWGIGKYQKLAEGIMDAGRAGEYETAVAWLRQARDIYQQHNRHADWRRYLDGLLEAHHRKYKLVPLLRTLRL